MGLDIWYQVKSDVPWWGASSQDIVCVMAVGSCRDSGSCGTGNLNSVRDANTISPSQPRIDTCYGILAGVSGMTVTGTVEVVSGGR